MFARAKDIVRRLAVLGNTCPGCGGKSVYMDTNGKQHCMDCGHEW